jgi:hypothetical protein
MAKKQLDPKAKAKRQKIYAGVGGVLLLGLLAVQGPRTMKMLHQPNVTSTSSSSSSTTPTGSTSSLAPPTLAGNPTGATDASGGSGALADPDTAPAPRAGQLVSFDRFRSKDPFSQQIDVACGKPKCTVGSSGSSAPTSSSLPPSLAGGPSTGTTGPTSAGAPTGVTGGAGSASSAKQQPATAATISVNGVAEKVSVGGTFPSSNPIFQLASLTRTAAKIAIVGGSYEGGAATISLGKGKTVTLQNTADGAQYRLQLLAIS